MYFFGYKTTADTVADIVPMSAIAKKKLNEGRPVIEGLSHIMFIVRDLDKMEDILMKVLDAK